MNDTTIMNDTIISAELIKLKISESIPKVIEEMFTRAYSNPLRDAIEATVKEKDWEIKQFVRDLLWEIVSDVGFRNEVKNALVAKILMNGIK